jgi:hypothetical protein
MDLTVERELLSPNKWQGRHWSFKSRDTKDWESMLMCACVLKDRRVMFNRKPLVPFRRRVTVTRIVPGKRNFIKDDDNLRFAVKPLNDALKRLGLIYEDSRHWLEQTLPTQEVSCDGKYYTRILIELVR